MISDEILAVDSALLSWLTETAFFWICAKIKIKKFILLIDFIITSLRNIFVKHDHGYVQLVVSTFRSFPHSLLTTGLVFRVKRRVSLAEQWLRNLLEHRVARS